MKKLNIALALSAAVATLAIQAQGQGTIWLNSYDANKGIFQGSGTTPAPAGTFFEVLGGTSAGSLAPIVNNKSVSSFTLAAGDINGGGANTGTFFDVGYGVIPTVAPAGTAFLQIIAWSGAANYATALTTVGAWAGSSTIWSQAIGTAVPAPPNAPTPATLLMPGNINLVQTAVVVPEPSTIALAGLGLAGLLAFRRRK